MATALLQPHGRDRDTSILSNDVRTMVHLHFYGHLYAGG